MKTTRTPWWLGALTSLIACACSSPGEPSVGAEAPARGGEDVIASGNGGDDQGSEGSSGSGSTGGGGSTSTMDAGRSADGGARPDAGQGDGSDVITIGDSYMKTAAMPATGTELSLEKVSGRNYRNYGNLGGSLFPPKAVAVLNGVIPGQLTQAKAEKANIKTVIVAAGGNDLTNDCKGAKTEAELTPACKKVLADIGVGLDKMMASFASAGVEDVIWVGYGDTTSTTNVLTGAFDAMRAERKAKCVANNPALGLRCHFVDTRAAVAGKLVSDGFHPSAAGFDAIAAVVWDRMKVEGVRR